MAGLPPARARFAVKTNARAAAALNVFFMILSSRLFDFLADIQLSGLKILIKN
jgi:hypothetical protein